MILFDSHSHLNDPAFDEDREDVIARMRAGGMAGAMVIACNDEDLPKTIEIVEAHPGFLFGAWAVHPEYPDHREASEEEIARVASHPQFKAVGETGLDFTGARNPWTGSANASANTSVRPESRKSPSSSTPATPKARPSTFSRPNTRRHGLRHALLLRYHR